MQSIHIAENEYIKAYGGDAWRGAVHNSVSGNHEYLFPPAPKPPQPQSHQPQPQPPAPSSNVVAGLQTGQVQASQSAPQPIQSPNPPLPATSAEFVHQVVARLQSLDGNPPQPSQPQTPHAHSNATPSSPV